MKEKQFNLFKPIQTRDGKKARIICTDAKMGSYSVIALIEEGGMELMFSYTPDGKYRISEECSMDLVNVPKKKEGWINIYNTEDYFSMTSRRGSFIHNNEEEAKTASERCDDYITTVKIEWEE